MLKIRRRDKEGGGASYRIVRRVSKISKTCRILDGFAGHDSPRWENLRVIIDPSDVSVAVALLSFDLIHLDRSAQAEESRLREMLWATRISRVEWHGFCGV